MTVLLYLFCHPTALHTARGYDFLFLIGPASLWTLAIIPYQHNVSRHIDKLSFGLICSTLDTARDLLLNPYNRRGLDNWLSCNNQAASLAVVLIDMDYLKNINDNHGNATSISLIRAAKSVFLS